MIAAVGRPFVLAQLSDPHIGGEWGGGDPAAGLAAVLEGIRALPQPPDAVLVTGDLADHAADAEYEHVRDALARIDAPAYVLPGNHDDRRALHRHFDVPGSDGEPVQYAVELGPLRLVALDTTRPGEDAGALDDGRLGWLDRELAASGVPTLIALHHPPLLTGVEGMDRDALPKTDARALGEILERHPQVRCVAGGHVHRVLTAQLAGRPVLTAPSTYVQVRPDFDSGRVEVAHEGFGFVLHTLLDGELVSHVQPVAG